MNLNRKQYISLPLTFAVALSACAPAPTESAGSEPRGGAIERRLAAMGTSLTVLAEANTRPEALAQSELAVRAIEAVETRLSTWRQESELARVNAADAGSPIPLSKELARDLHNAQRIWRETNGSFDPALGPLVAAWDLRGQGRTPNDETLQLALQDSGWQHYLLTEQTLTRTHAAAQIEEGGFGKGVALDAALGAIDAQVVRNFSLELGGQWIVRTEEDAPFVMGIAHPEQRQQPILELRMSHGSAATSGNSERGIVVDGKAFGHILDAKTGRPAADFGSMTVLAEDALTADCLSTALFVMGPDPALAWVSKRADVELVVVELTHTTLRVRATAGLTESLTPISSDLEIEFVSKATDDPGQ